MKIIKSFLFMSIEFVKIKAFYILLKIYNKHRFSISFWETVLNLNLIKIFITHNKSWIYKLYVKNRKNPYFFKLLSMTLQDAQSIS